MVDDLGMNINLVWRQWRAAFVAGVVVAFPIILSVDRYIDDIDRSMHGRMNWDRAGRPLADFLFSAANFGQPATAVSPLYTLVAVAVLALAAVVVSRCYGIRSPFWVAMGALPLMAQPYGLQNLAYGFDALGMAVALALAVVAAVLIQRSNHWRFQVAGNAALLMSVSLYQPAASGFIPCAGFLVIAALSGLLVSPWTTMTIAARIGRSVVAYGIALGVYRVLNAIWFDHRLTSYAADGARFKTIDFAGAQALAVDVIKPWAQFVHDFGRWPVVLPLFLLLLLYGVLLARLHSPQMLVCCVVMACMVALLSPGALLLIRDSFLHKPRVAMFFGPLLMSVVLQVIAASERVGWKGLRAGIFPLIWLLLVFSFAFGHAFAAQAKFERMQVSRLIGDVARWQEPEYQSRFRRVAVVGDWPRSPVLLNTARKFPLVERLIPSLMADGWTFGISQLALYGLPLERVDVPNQVLLNFSCDEKSVLCTGEYQLRRFDQDALLIQLLPNGVVGG